MGLFTKLKTFLDKKPGTPDFDEKARMDTIEQEHKERRSRPRVNAKAGTKVLIIDDSKTVCSLLKKMMLQNDYQVFTALNAEAGLNIVYKHDVDLIFLDIVLPGIDGFAALRQLRKDKRSSNIPVIMMSGNHQATEIFYASRIGADDFLKKPFSRYEIFFRIEKLLTENFELERNRQLF